MSVNGGSTKGSLTEHEWFSLERTLQTDRRTPQNWWTKVYSPSFSTDPWHPYTHPDPDCRSNTPLVRQSPPWRPPSQKSQEGVLLPRGISSCKTRGTYTQVMTDGREDGILTHPSTRPPPSTLPTWTAIRGEGVWESKEERSHLGEKDGFNPLRPIRPTRRICSPSSGVGAARWSGGQKPRGTGWESRGRRRQRPTEWRVWRRKVEGFKNYKIEGTERPKIERFF